MKIESANKSIEYILSVIGFVSLSSNFQEFHGFIGDFIEWYQSLVHPILLFPFHLLNMAPPSWFADYLAIGIIFGNCYFQGMLYEGSNPIITDNRGGGSLWAKRTNVVIFSSFIWPLVLLLTLFPSTQPDKENFSIVSQVTWKWVRFSFTGSIIVFALNYIGT